MRALSCAAWNDAVLSISITATMCCRQMSGMSRLSTTAPTRRRQPHDDTAFTSSASNGRLRAHVLDRVERRLNRRADGPLLDVGVDDLVALAELLDRAAPGRPSGALTWKKLSSPENTSSTPFQPASDEQRGGHAVARRHAAEDESLLDVVGVAAPDRVSRRPAATRSRAASASAARSRPATQPAAAAEPNVPGERVRAAARSSLNVTPPSAIVMRGPTS